MLKALLTAEQFEGLGDDLKAFYIEKDGSYLLNVTSVGGYELAEVGGLKKALSKERETNEKSTTLLKTFEGIDPEEAKSALAKMAEMDEWEPEQKTKELQEHLAKKFEDDRKKLVEKHSAELLKSTKYSEQLSTQLQETMIMSSATKAISEAHGSIDLLLPIIKNQTRMKQQQDGSFVAEVLDFDGSVRLSTSPGSAEPMSVAEFVVTLREDEKFSRAFDPAGSTGSGATNSDGKFNGGTHMLSTKDAYNPAKYQAAKAAAAEAGSELKIG